MRYLSLFSGIGGFELGIRQAHHVDSTHRSEDGRKQKDPSGSDEARQGLVPATGQNSRTEEGSAREYAQYGNDSGELDCVGFSEIDKYATQIYQSHFPTHKNYGDITKIDANTLPDFDLLVGGFPCQSFSIAGKRGGFNDTRGTLFFDVARILAAKKPRLFVLENVKGLLSHEGGKTFAVIISSLDELGYDVQWQVLNSKNFGVPQNRERVYIVGNLRGTPRPQVFPISGGITENTQATSEAGIKVGTLRTHKDGNGFREMKEGICPTIPARAREDGSGQPVIIDLKATENSTRRGAISQTGNAKTLDHNCAQGVMVSKTVRSGGRSSPHGSKQNWDSYEFDGQIRRLTPVECERLQGFPDNWTARGMTTFLPNKIGDSSHQGGFTTSPISDTQRYKTLGNAVTVNVVQAVMERILFTK